MFAGGCTGRIEDTRLRKQDEWFLRMRPREVVASEAAISANEFPQCNVPASLQMLFLKGIGSASAQYIRPFHIGNGPAATGTLN